MGCNGVDNGKLSFSNVRVPREALLNAHSDVSPAVSIFNLKLCCREYSHPKSNLLVIDSLPLQISC